jgi:peroxiredoxin Q/BCP
MMMMNSSILITTALLCMISVLSILPGAKAFSSMVMSSSTSPTKNEKGVLGRKAFFQSVATASSTIVTASTLLTPVPPAYAMGGGGGSNLPQTGVEAPSFTLPTSRGGTKSLEDLTSTGKWTVLYFYPGAFTSGCTLEARGFQRDIAEYQSLGTQIVGVSVDAVEKNASFCSEEKLDFYMLTDDNGIVSKKYGSALKIPGFGTFSNRQTYIIDPKGDLRWVFTDVESHVSRHSAEVLDKLKDLKKSA